MDKKKTSKKKIFIVGQIIFLVLVFAMIYILYPKTSLELSGNFVKFDSINTDLIIISENPDFSNPRYLDLSENKRISFELAPGKYYWKSSNGIIESFSKEFEINSEVGMQINENNETNSSELENVGNIKINVTKTKDGMMVGHIILEPEQAEKIENKNESYEGRQDGN